MQTGNCKQENKSNTNGVWGRGGGSALVGGVWDYTKSSIKCLFKIPLSVKPIVLITL